MHLNQWHNGQYWAKNEDTGEPELVGQMVTPHYALVDETIAEYQDGPETTIEYLIQLRKTWKKHQSLETSLNACHPHRPTAIILLFLQRLTTALSHYCPDPNDRWAIIPNNKMEKMGRVFWNITNGFLNEVPTEWRQHALILIEPHLRQTETSYHQKQQAPNKGWYLCWENHYQNRGYTLHPETVANLL